jgi:hypothetical protein
MTWQQVAALIAANFRTKAVIPAGAERTVSAPGRGFSLPAFGPGGMRLLREEAARQHGPGARVYRCKVSSDHPVGVNDHPRSLAVREDGILPYAEAWYAGSLRRERIETTAAQIVHVDSRSHPDPGDAYRVRAQNFPNTSTD